MTIASLLHSTHDHGWPAQALLGKLHRQWSRDPALWRSIATGLGVAALGLVMAGAAFGVLTP
jgi:hypothetical protein